MSNSDVLNFVPYQNHKNPLNFSHFYNTKQKRKLVIRKEVIEEPIFPGKNNKLLKQIN